MSKSPSLSDHHFVLVHGFGNTALEMSRLQSYLDQQDISNTLLTLPFHSSLAEFENFEIDAFLDQFRAMISEELRNRDRSRVIIVSASLGSLALLQTKGLVERAKHVLIAPFLGTTPIRAKFLGLFDAIAPNYWFKRNYDPDAEFERQNFSLHTHLKVRSANQVEQLAQSVRTNVGGFPPDSLIVHSYSDRVASFKQSARFYEKDRANSDFINLLGAPHSFANTLNPKVLIELVFEHFYGKNDGESDSSERLKTQYVELNYEHRDWATKIFNLVIGFVTGFGILTYQTLNEILEGKDSAPYLLMAYVTVIYLYVIMATLYFYYLNRTQNYLSSFIEPTMRGVGFQQFKLSKNLSGSESVTLTFNTSFALIVLPFIIASTALAYTAYTFNYRIFLFSFENLLLQFWLLSNVALYGLAQVGAIRLARSTTKTIYAPPVAYKRTVRKIELIVALVASASYRKQ